MSVLDSHYGECVRWREQGASYEALMTRAGGCRPPLGSGHGSGGCWRPGKRVLATSLRQFQTPNQLGGFVFASSSGGQCRQGHPASPSNPGATAAMSALVFSSALRHSQMAVAERRAKE